MPRPTEEDEVEVDVEVDDDDELFPIADYDDLRANQILPLLPELDDDELALVAERERSGVGPRPASSAASTSCSASR